jgi:hypothetical protein
MTTLRALLDVLSPAVTCQEAGADLERTVDEVVLIGPGDPLPDHPGALLLCLDPDDLGDGPVTAAGVVVKDLPAGSSVGVPVVLAERTVPWNHLLHLLTSALDPREGAGDLFALANALASVVGGAVAVEDPQRRVLAYSSLPDQPIDAARQQGILGRQVPDLSRNDSIYREVQRSAGVVRVPGDGDVLPRLAVAVRSGAELLGSIWVVESTPVAVEHEAALLDASRLAALQLLRTRARSGLDRRERGELVRALLDGRSSPELAATRLGLQPGAAVAVLGFALPEHVAADDLDADSVGDLVHLQCTAVHPRASALLQLGTVYVLLPAEELSRARLLALGAAVLERSRASLRVELRAAVGATVHGLHAAPRSRADVDAVLQLVAPGEVAAVEDVLPQVGLQHLKGHLAAAPHLRLPAVQAMLQHDEDHETPYAESVLAYLTANADTPAAAAAVNVHPNTFRYRMRRVRELFDLDLEDPDVRLMTWLQLRTSS